MDKPLVSIAVCTYNGEKFLIEQLESIVNQTYPNLEIIVVDDCSSDQTMAILSDYALKFNNIKIYENEVNLGYIKNFEKAISLCEGEYISLCDQDDIWDLSKIELQVKFIRDNVMVYHDSELINENGITIDKKMSDFRNFYSGNDARHFLMENCVSGHSILFNKNLIQYLLPFPQEIFHDWWIAYCAANLGQISFQETVLVKYRQHANTSTDISKKRQSIIKQRINKLSELTKKVEIFNTYHHNKHQKFTAKLFHLLKKNSYSLSVFVWKHQAVLLFMQKKNLWSKFNFCRKLKI